MLISNKDSGIIHIIKDKNIQFNQDHPFLIDYGTFNSNHVLYNFIFEKYNHELTSLWILIFNYLMLY